MVKQTFRVVYKILAEKFHVSSRFISSPLRYFVSVPSQLNNQIYKIRYKRILNLVSRKILFHARMKVLKIFFFSFLDLTFNIISGTEEKEMYRGFCYFHWMKGLTHDSFLSVYRCHTRNFRHNFRSIIISKEIPWSLIFLRDKGEKFFRTFADFIRFSHDLFPVSYFPYKS